MDALLGVCLICLFWTIVFIGLGKLAEKKFDSVVYTDLCYGFAAGVFLVFVAVSSAYILRLLVA